MLNDFQTYGNVTTNAGSYVFTEDDNAGCFEDFPLDIGAEKLRFRCVRKAAGAAGR